MTGETLVLRTKKVWCTVNQERQYDQRHICTLLIEGIYFHALLFEAQGSIHLQVMVAATRGHLSVLSPSPCQSETIQPLIDQPTTGQDKGCEEEEEGIGSRGRGGREDAKTHFAGGGTGHSTKTELHDKITSQFSPKIVNVSVLPKCSPTHYNV